ncbi:MAG: U32 family peptidase [Eggerthellaceae bacterium]|nr:U32 family peptidase [Eggerthellaceae bacterium]
MKKTPSALCRPLRVPKKLPELLAPAGGMDQLKAAIKFGADAVYLATKDFGMREAATNFTMDDLTAACKLAHKNSVKVYVACNVVMNDSDIALLPQYFEEVEAAWIDALIISDLGAMRLARKLVPEIDIHVSTQLSVSNVETALAMYEMGAKRIVAARELSLAQIKEMKAAFPPDLKLECFIHGAMCMAVSGRCIISDVLTGRHANKGACAQPCRWRYNIVEETRQNQFFPIEEDQRGTYIFNSKDIKMVEYLREIVDAGVDSFKIEGRNKKAFYVAGVVNAYRQVLDNLDSPNYNGILQHSIDELNCISHRPYSTGFYFEKAEQSDSQDGYSQDALHVADLLDQFDSNKLLVRCRNKIEPGDQLEILQPGCEVPCFKVKEILWKNDGNEIPVKDASRTMDEYVLVLEDEAIQIEPNTFIRK